MITVRIEFVGSWLVPCLRILEIFRVIGALSLTTTARWHTTVRGVSNISCKLIRAI